MNLAPLLALLLTARHFVQARKSPHITRFPPHVVLDKFPQISASFDSDRKTLQLRQWSQAGLKNFVRQSPDGLWVVSDRHGREPPTFLRSSPTTTTAAVPSTTSSSFGSPPSARSPTARRRIRFRPPAIPLPPLPPPPPFRLSLPNGFRAVFPNPTLPHNVATPPDGSPRLWKPKAKFKLSRDERWNSQADRRIPFGPIPLPSANPALRQTRRPSFKSPQLNSAVIGAPSVPKPTPSPFHFSSPRTRSAVHSIAFPASGFLIDSHRTGLPPRKRLFTTPLPLSPITPTNKHIWWIPPPTRATLLPATRRPPPPPRLSQHIPRLPRRSRAPFQARGRLSDPHFWLQPASIPLQPAFRIRVPGSTSLRPRPAFSRQARKKKKKKNKTKKKKRVGRDPSRRRFWPVVSEPGFFFGASPTQLPDRDHRPRLYQPRYSPRPSRSHQAASQHRPHFHSFSPISRVLPAHTPNFILNF